MALNESLQHALYYDSRLVLTSRRVKGSARFISVVFSWYAILWIGQASRSAPTDWFQCNASPLVGLLLNKLLLSALVNEYLVGVTLNCVT
jgi:hypothetical protein